MDHGTYRSKLASLTAQRHRHRWVIGGLLATNLVLAGVLYTLVGTQRIIVTPPTLNQPIWVSGSAMAPRYLAAMSRYFATLRLTVSSGTADYQHEILLHHVAPTYYSALKAQLAKERDHLQRHHVATAFYPKKTQVAAKAHTVVVTGVLKTMVGDEPANSRQTRYRLHYTRANDHLLLQSFKEVKPDGD